MRRRILWTLERTEQLIEFAALGMTETQIADELNIKVRNVRGKLKQLERDAKSQITKRDARPVTLQELGDKTCRWPLWSDDGLPTEPRVFCGAPCPGVALSEPYCSKHAAQNYRGNASRNGPIVYYWRGAK